MKQYKLLGWSNEMKEHPKFDVWQEQYPIKFPIIANDTGWKYPDDSRTVYVTDANGRTDYLNLECFAYELILMVVIALFFLFLFSI